MHKNEIFLGLFCYILNFLLYITFLKLLYLFFFTQLIVIESLGNKRELKHGVYVEEIAI